MSRHTARAAAAAAVLAIVLAYAFDAGHGFIKDDFAWILASRIERASDLTRLAEPLTGFFRPVVSVSFAVDYALYGVEPLGYGLTNLALLLGSVGVLALMLRAAGNQPLAAAGAALLWGLNFQGINMAVLWISGRTALIVCFWSVATAWAWLRHRHAAAAACAALAMLSKEEAFALPAILTAWAIIDVSDRREPGSGRLRAVVRRTWMLWTVAAACLILRSQSAAFTPASAPPVYQYQYDAVALIDNAASYADRVGTTTAGALVLFWLAAGLPRVSALAGGDRWILKGVVWLALAFVPTILLPVRSSLYALLPGIGVAVVAANLIDRIAARVHPGRLTRAVAALAALFVLLVPVYRLRNVRLVREAELSRDLMRELTRIAATAGGGLVVIKDARDVRPTAEQALGQQADRAAELVTGGRLRLWIDPPPAELSSAPAPDLSAPAAVLVVARGAVRRAP